MNDLNQLICTFRRVFALLIFLCLSLSTAKAGISVFTSVGDGDWNNPCTWSNTCPSPAVVGVNIPGPNSDVIIFDGHNVTVNVNATVSTLTINKSAGGNRTNLIVMDNLTLRVTGPTTTTPGAIPPPALTIHAGGELVIHGGALVYVDGSTCVKNNGSVTMIGPEPTPSIPDPPNGSLFLKGCVTVGSQCDQGFTSTNGTPNFIEDDNLNWCISCVNNNAATNVGNPSNFCAMMLPVELATFLATVQEDEVNGGRPRVALAWTTVSETNNAYFAVERSTDGAQFTEIFRLDGAGNTTGPVAYREYDDTPPFGTVYYRIRQTDTDGQAEASKAVAVQVGMGGKLQMTISPVPLHGKHLYINHTQAETPSFQLLNALGVPLNAGHYSVTAEPYRATLTLAAALPPGLYYLRASSSGTVVTGKVIVP